MKNTEKDLQKVEKQSNISKGVVALAGLTVASSAFAGTTTDSFTDLFTIFKNWLQGDLGRYLLY